MSIALLAACCCNLACVFDGPGKDGNQDGHDANANSGENKNTDNLLEDETKMGNTNTTRTVGTENNIDNLLGPCEGHCMTTRNVKPDLQGIQYSSVQSTSFLS